VLTEGAIKQEIATRRPTKRHTYYSVNQVVQQLSGSVPRAVASGYWQSRRSLPLAVLIRRIDQRSTTSFTEYSLPKNMYFDRLIE